jgi:hypothetical protein
MQDREWNWRNKSDQANRDWQTAEREGRQDWQSGESNRDRDWRTGERESEQGWRTGEREASQGWSREEREREQLWRTGERNSQNSWQSAENDKQLSRNVERDYLQSLFAKDRMAYNMQLMGYMTPGASFGGNQAGRGPTLNTSKGTQFPESTTGDLMGNFIDSSTQTGGGRVLKNSLTPNQTDFGQSIGTQTSFSTNTMSTQTPAGSMVKTADLASQTPKAGLGKRISRGFQAGSSGRGTSSFASEVTGGPGGMIMQAAWDHKNREPMKPAGHAIGSMFIR